MWRADPRRFTYDWSGFNQSAVNDFTRILIKCMGEFGMVLPSAWTGPTVHESNTIDDVGGSKEDFLRMED